MPAFDLQNYISVQERINAFWKDYPNGAIRTYLVSDGDNFQQCRYNAAVFKECTQTNPDATGWAFELAGSGMANKTSHEENCETSAIGRALANLGYATTQESRPSREEMMKVAADTAQTRQAPAPMPARSQQTATNVTPTETQQPTLTAVDAEVHDWSSLWSVIRKPPFRIVTRDDFAELVQRTPDQFISPQHAFNAVKKALRERDAAIDSGRDTATAK
jgi:hypothetical protein